MTSNIYVIDILFRKCVVIAKYVPRGNVQKADRILNQVFDSYYYQEGEEQEDNNTNDEDEKPNDNKIDVKSCNIVMDAWSKLISSSSSLQDDTTTTETVLPENKAHNILNRMKDLSSRRSKHGRRKRSKPCFWLRPDIVSYNTVMKCYSKASIGRTSLERSGTIFEQYDGRNRTKYYLVQYHD